MLIISFVISLFIISGSGEIPIQNYAVNPNILKCTTNIIQKYYADARRLAYVNLDYSADELLRNIHALNIVSVNTRRPPATVPRQNNAYMIVTRNVREFSQNIMLIYKEANWNPYPRFLIMIRWLQRDELRQVFDVLFKLRVYNVVVINGTATTELYTYNPYADYACGKYYNEITEFGNCLDVTQNIYPYKFVTGLRKCFFNVSVPHWPPYGIDPAKASPGTNTIGTEQYIFHLMSEIEQFNYTFNFNYDPETFSLVSNNLSVSGPMSMLLNNLTDIMLGGLILIPSRAKVFFYINGHLDQVDEVRLIVKKAWEIPAWKDFYLEFTPTVWALLLIALLFYSALVAILLNKKDKAVVVMTLLDNLLSHGAKLNSRRTVNVVFIIWVWFAYLINSFYTTSLVSHTMKPTLGYQISDEETIVKRGLTPCLSIVMNKFKKSESNPGQIINDVNTDIKGCQKLLESIKSVSESDSIFTIAIYCVYSYNKYKFYDQYGRVMIYSLKKPYAKVIYAMYFNKGFPLYERLHTLAMRIRETGLSDKSLNDHFYSQQIKYHFHSRGFVSRSAISWHIYVIGLVISTVTFFVELASQYKSMRNMSK